MPPGRLAVTRAHTHTHRRDACAHALARMPSRVALSWVKRRHGAWGWNLMRSEPTWLGDQLFQGKARSRTFGQGAIGGNARESRHANHTRTHAMRTAAKGQHDRRRMAFFLARRREERTHVKFNRFAHDCKSRRAVPWSSRLCRKGIYRDIRFPATLANKTTMFSFFVLHAMLVGLG